MLYYSMFVFFFKSVLRRIENSVAKKLRLRLPGLEIDAEFVTGKIDDIFDAILL